MEEMGATRGGDAVILTTLRDVEQCLMDHDIRELPPLAASGNCNPHSDTSPELHVTVKGQFVRKRKLSKGLVFGDIKLQDGELLEVMIRAADGVLTVEDIRTINWDVHLGDYVTARGVLQRKLPASFLFVLHSIQVNEPWKLHHQNEKFDQSQHDSNIGNFHACITATTTEGASASVLGSLTLAPASQITAKSKYTNIVTINGFNACKYYFSGAGGVNCLRGTQCHFWHGAPEEFDANRKLWLTKRLAQRKEASQIEGDDADPHAKHLKAQRGRMFCEWLVETLGAAQLAQGSGVIDIAGGKGDIPIQLWNLRGIPTTLIDPRPMKLSKANRKLVASTAAAGRGMCRQLLRCLDNDLVAEHTELFSDCSILLGMHPDEATEAIVDTAMALKKPFAIVPCCVMSRQFPDRVCKDGTPVAMYETLVTYLMEKHSQIQKAFLPFAGRNQVLYLFKY